MLNITIDNPELENSLKQTYGSDESSISSAFFDFIKQQKIKQDIGVSIKQFESGDSMSLSSAMNKLREKYE